MPFEHLEKDIVVDISYKNDFSGLSKEKDSFITDNEILELFTPETLEVLLKKCNLKKH